MEGFSVFVVAVTAATWGYYPTVAIIVGPTHRYMGIVE